MDNAILQRRIDYLYCETCAQNVPCVALGNDTWEVQCSHCVGQCGLCACRGNATPRHETFFDPHIHVARGKREPHIPPTEVPHE